LGQLRREKGKAIEQKNRGSPLYFLARSSLEREGVETWRTGSVGWGKEEKKGLQKGGEALDEAVFEMV